MLPYCTDAGGDGPDKTHIPGSGPDKTHIPGSGPDYSSSHSYNSSFKTRDILHNKYCNNQHRYM